MVLLPPQVWVLKRELTWVPFFGWALRAAALASPSTAAPAAAR